MAASYLNALRTAGKAQITHLGLVDETGTELTGGSPAYARIAETWADDGDGIMRPAADRTFNVPAGTTVGGWRGFSASSGGTNHGGADLTQEVFAGQGTYTLLAASSGVVHSAS